MWRVDGQVVRDEEVGQAEVVLQPHQQVQHLRLDRDVERRDRLVGDDELGLHRERPGDADALALPAAELARPRGRRARRQPDTLEQVVDARVAALSFVDRSRARPAPRRASGARSSSGSATSTGPGRSTWIALAQRAASWPRASMIDALRRRGSRPTSAARAAGSAGRACSCPSRSRRRAPIVSPRWIESDTSSTATSDLARLARRAVPKRPRRHVEVLRQAAASREGAAALIVLSA